MAKKAETVKEREQGKSVKKEQYITTGSTLRDLELGGKTGAFGYRVGSIYNVVGDSSSGKTLITVQSIVANYFKLGDKFKWVYDDCESGFSFDVSTMYGMDVPIIDADTPHSKTVEALYSNIRKFADSLSADEIGFYVVDSLDGLTSEETVERGDQRYEKALEGKEFKKGTYGGGKPKFLSQEFFPDVATRIEDSNVILIIISQVRDKINATMFEKKQVRAGGKALQFYCRGVEWLSSHNKKEMEDEKSGLRAGAPILIVNDKLKAPRGYRKCVQILDFSIGVDDIASNIDFLYDLRTDKTLKLRPTKRDKLEWGDGKFSRDELCDYIYDNELEEELKKRVIEKWEAQELAIVNRRKARF